MDITILMVQIYEKFLIMKSAKLVIYPFLAFVKHFTGLSEEDIKSL